MDFLLVTESDAHYILSWDCLYHYRDEEFYLCAKSITEWIMYQELWKSIGYSRKSHECFQIPQKQSHSDKYTWVADCVHQAFFNFLETHLTIFPASMHLFVDIGHWNSGTIRRKQSWVSVPVSLGPSKIASQEGLLTYVRFWWKQEINLSCIESLTFMFVPRLTQLNMTLTTAQIHHLSRGNQLAYKCQSCKS